MTRTLLALTAVVALAASTVPAFAQDQLASKVTVDLRAVSPEQAFRNVASVIGMKVAVDPKVTAPLDILVRDVTARTALTAMCESIGCIWTASANTITVKPRHEFGLLVDAKSGQARATIDRIQGALKRTLPAGMTFENAPLADVDARLSAALDLKVELISDDPMLRTLTADFSNQTLLEAIKGLYPQGDRADTWRIRITVSADKSPTIMLGIKVDKKKTARRP